MAGEYVANLTVSTSLQITCQNVTEYNGKPLFGTIHSLIIGVTLTMLIGQTSVFFTRVLNSGLFPITPGVPVSVFGAATIYDYLHDHSRQNRTMSGLYMTVNYQGSSPSPTPTTPQPSPTPSPTPTPVSPSPSPKPSPTPTPSPTPLPTGSPSPSPSPTPAPLNPLAGYVNSVVLLGSAGTYTSTNRLSLYWKDLKTVLSFSFHDNCLFAFPPCLGRHFDPVRFGWQCYRLRLRWLERRLVYDWWRVSACLD